MENNKLFELIKELSPSEFAEFGVFLNSPFLNTSKYAISLYNTIKKYYPDLDSDALTKELIFSKLYPGEKFKDKKLRDLFSLTNDLAEDYLAITAFKNDMLAFKSYKLKELGGKDLRKHFEQISREIESALGKMEVKDDKYFFFYNNLLMVRRLCLEFKESYGKRELFYIQLGDEIEQFVLHFVSRMLYYYVDQFTNLMTIKHETNFQLLDEIISFLDKKNLESYPQINVLYHIVTFLRDKTKLETLDNIEKLVNTPGIEIDMGLLRDAYIVLFNCFKELSMKNIGNYSEKYFGIMKQMVGKELLPIENGYFESTSFDTFVLSGIIHKEFEWTRLFIEKYHKKLRPEFRENLYLYSMGLLSYGLKNYDKALSLLAKVKTDDFTVYTRIKLYFIRIYFETKDYDRALANVDALRHHLKANEKMTDIYVKRYLTFTSYMGKALTAIFAEDFDRLHFIHEEIKAASVFEFRKWMIEILGQILKEEYVSKKP